MLLPPPRINISRSFSCACLNACKTSDSDSARTKRRAGPPTFNVVSGARRTFSRMSIGSERVTFEKLHVCGRPLTAQRASSDQLELCCKVPTAQLFHLVISLLRFTKVPCLKLSLGEVVISDHIFFVTTDRIAKLIRGFLEVVLLTVRNSKFVDGKYPLRLLRDDAGKRLDRTWIVTKIGKGHAEIQKRSLDIFGARKRSFLQRNL